MRYFIIIRISVFFQLLALAATILSCNADTMYNEKNEDRISNSPSLIPFALISKFSHDVTAFTEGFTFENGVLYESTGSPNELPQTKSIVGVVNLSNGKIDTKIELNKEKYFGEGISFLKDKLYQLTYLNNICFVYDSKSFKKIAEHRFLNKEGWGLTTDGKNLIMSDGTNKLTYIDPTNFKPIKTMQIFESGIARDSLNELEYINGYIYANVWMNNYICKIDTSTGNVVGKIDLNSIALYEKLTNKNCDVLNGIAYDSSKNKIYVTGKLWKNIYQIDFPH